MTRDIGLSTLLLLLVSVPSGAAPPDADYHRLNLDLVDGHVLPRHERLVAATVVLERQARVYCDAPTTEGLDTLRRAWHAGADAWQGVQHLRFGPIELFMRGMRVAFWPDPRGSVGRQVDELLAAIDAATLSPDAFPRNSIAVQGLPALERLLFDGGADWRGEAAAFRCTLMHAISRNVATIANDVLREWRDGDTAYRKVIEHAAEPGGHYHLDREATLDLFKSLHAAVELVADHKLRRPLGEVIQAARPQLAESWRSGRSLDNIRLNLAAAEAMYLGEGGHGFSRFVREVARDEALDDLFRRAFAQTRTTAGSIELPLEQAVHDPTERRKVEKLAREAGALKALLAQRLAPALGIPVGFNALDGD